ncbi:hypothetical protein HBI24_119210 [Parastagonospora nodorum]|nr:hypothetical protein HBH49_185080 [Parastagonospora nodorum]KAH4262922.1 hypothetical protein HBI03_101860 [Parastagonospora nodorum]KAH4274957.1 hypothetical protein HBI04_127670 [Parastagonospora nodorum]KAH4906265.1 hypothetical protein HBI80_079120 [Parastagonospora nodorum]KAH4965512.1 hypothetical protein HBI78_100810 [Parastagonospora nodorum]
MFPFIPRPTKKRSSTRVKYATLYAILADIEALHERVHELAYYKIERSLPSNGMPRAMSPAYPYAPPSPTSSGLPTWFSQRSMPMQDHPPRYVYPSSPPLPPPRYEKRRSRSPDSPAPVFRLRGGFGAHGVHGTPKITRAAPDRRAKRDNGNKREKRVRMRDRKVVEEADSESGSGSEESDDEDEEMRDAQGDRDRRDGRGGLGRRRVAV